MDQKVSTSEIKVKNRQAIYKFIRENGPVSKQDIVYGLQLSLPTVTQNLQYLKQHGLIDTSKKITNTGGRNATAYSFIENAKAAIGIYTTAHHINAVAVDLAGTNLVVIRRRVPFDIQSDSYLKKIGDMVEETKERAGISDENLLGVGIAVPSLVSEDGERVIYGMTLNFTGVTREHIARYIPYPNRLYHDSCAMGYSEVWGNKQLKNAFCIGLNYSVEGCAIIDGMIHEGDTRKAGDICHMVLEPHNGKTCYCGRKGCMDTVCNVGVLDQLTGGNLEAYFELLRSGDEQAAALWDEYLDYLSIGIVNIRLLFDCPVILSGYMGIYIKDYMDELRRRVDARFPFEEPSEGYLFSTRHKIDGTAIGAALFYIEEFLQSI